MVNQPTDSVPAVDISQEVLRWRYLQEQQDRSQLGMLAIGYYVLGVFLALSSAMVVIWYYFGVWLSQSKPDTSSSPSAHGLPDASFNSIGIGMKQMSAELIVIGLIASLAIVAVGVCIQRRRAKVFVLVTAAFLCLLAPLGTVLGIATFIVLSRLSIRELFGERVSYPSV